MCEADWNTQDPLEERSVMLLDFRQPLTCSVRSFPDLHVNVIMPALDPRCLCLIVAMLGSWIPTTDKKIVSVRDTPCGSEFGGRCDHERLTSWYTLRSDHSMNG